MTKIRKTQKLKIDVLATSEQFMVNPENWEISKLIECNIFIDTKPYKFYTTKFFYDMLLVDGLILRSTLEKTEDGKYSWKGLKDREATILEGKDTKA